MDKLAIVILNFNGADIIHKFLPSVISNAKNNPVYIIDNASTDDSLNILEEYENQINLIKLAKNKGYAGGYNEGLKQINAKYYALINSDILFDQSSLESIVETFEANDKVGIIQPKILSYSNPDFFEYAGASGGYLDRYGYAFCRGRIFDTLELDQGQYDENKNIDWASGASLFIRSELFKKLGGFDSDYFAHYEEIDLCWRARSIGYNIRVIPQAKVYHLGGGTLDNSSPFKTYLNFRNSLFTLLKNLPSTSLGPKIFTRLVFDGIAGMRFVFRGEFRHLFAILRAHISFYIEAPKMYAKRKRIEKNTKVEFTTKSIIWSYFVLNKKKYSAL